MIRISKSIQHIKRVPRKICCRVRVWITPYHMLKWYLDINSKSRGNVFAHYYVQLGLPDKGCAIKGLIVHQANGCFTPQL